MFKLDKTNLEARYKLVLGATLNGLLRRGALNSLDATDIHWHPSIDPAFFSLHFDMASANLYRRFMPWLSKTIPDLYKDEKIQEIIWFEAETYVLGTCLAAKLRLLSGDSRVALAADHAEDEAQTALLAILELLARYE